MITSSSLPAILLSVAASTVSAQSHFAIREATDVGCGYGDSCWPADWEWGLLNLTVGGKIKPAIPTASVCHDTFGNYNAAKCAEVQANWDIGRYTSQPIGGYVANPWSDGYGDDYCSPLTNRTAPCGQGRVPPVFAEVESTLDILTVTAFARSHNLRLRVKSTGHSLTGGSSAKGAFGISVHKLNSIKFSNNYLLTGTLKTAGPAVTVGAGVEFADLYAAADKAGRVVVGGGCDSVSISGYTLGGGHSRYSPSLGLSVDQLLEFTIVTPEGYVLTVNEYYNTDLWWAVRGGGSGFGIITSWTVKTYPPVKNELVNRFQLVTTSQDLYADALFEYIKLQSTIRAERWSDLAITQKSSGVYVIIGAAFKPNYTSVEEEAALWDPLRTWATSTNSSFETVFTSYSSQYETTITEPFASQHEVPMDTQKSISRLLDASLWEDETKLRKVSDFLAALDAVNFLNVPGNAVSKTPSSPMALNPSWRTALSHVLWYATWPLGATKAQQTAARATGSLQLNALTKILGTDAAYINESDPDDLSWPHNYFGDNYDKLLSIKKKYDPNHYFTCTGCVGSEYPANQKF